MTEETKSAYIDKMNAQLREWTAQVEVMKAKVAKGSAEVRIDYHKRIEKWTEKEAQLKQKLTELRTIGAEGFESMKLSVQTVWNELSILTNSIEENKDDKNKKH